MRYTSEQVKDMCRAIESTGCEFTEWETKFMDSISEVETMLTEKQSNCLNKIYDKASGGGPYVKKQYFQR